MLLIVTDRAERGFWRFDNPWHSRVRLNTLCAFAESLDPDNAGKLTDGLAAQRAELDEVRRLAAEYANPLVITPGVTVVEAG